ncbi:MAG TPA: hypothetical protein VK823_02235 [Streptosporangiaceae bacterium]|jgi:hypothetical protein|nr:hypothetical protein [Streptosporangiaceae bacterium]
MSGPPEDPAAWAADGFTAEQAELFLRWRFTLRQAVGWRQAGVPDGLRAAQWSTAGVTPETVSQWRAAGIDATQAVHWHEMGFDLPAARTAVRKGLTPESAFGQRHGYGSRPAIGFGSQVGSPGRRIEPNVIHQLHEAGVPPRVIHSYLNGPWEMAEAVPWARAGLDATEAALWRTLGLTAAEAARLARKGASAADTIKEWWRAGIPFDEVADWIGAGLTAKEAADQRARGITAEQAAALRALRDQDADD